MHASVAVLYRLLLYVVHMLNVIISHDQGFSNYLSRKNPHQFKQIHII